MFTNVSAAQAAAIALDRIADRLEATFTLPSAYKVRCGIMAGGCYKPEIDFNIQKPWVVSSPQNGKANIDLGNYELQLNEHRSQIQIINKENGEVTNIWGDPHIDWNKDGRTDADFWTKTTFQLEDGTKITIGTEPWKGNDNMYVASEITITKGERAIQVNGISQNEIGDLKIEQSNIGGGLLDWAVTDGFVVKENPNGEGWINPETGKLATQDDFNITKPGADKPYEFTQQFSQALGAFLLTGALPGIPAPITDTIIIPPPLPRPGGNDEVVIDRKYDYFGHTKQVTIDAGAGDDNIHIHTNRNGSVIVTVNGENHYFTASEARNLEIRGGRGNDVISSSGEQSSFHKTFFGETKITINGGRGNDVIMGGAGSETINGGRGNDVIFGGDGNDNINGGRGNDTIYGGSGNDNIRGDRGNDAIYGGSGNDNIRGGRGNDVISGGSGNDNIRGGRGNDYLNGGSGNDRVFGDRGQDRLVGGAGNDYLNGGRGWFDTADGGPGIDKVVRARQTDTPDFSIFGPFQRN